MPRKSAAALAAQRWQVGRQHPRPPAGMSALARKLWLEVVLARPPQFFLPGATHLLQSYCEVTATLQQSWQLLAASPHDNKLVTRVKTLANLQASLARGLRITVQTGLRHENAQYLERMEPPPAEHAHLFQGREVLRERMAARAAKSEEEDGEPPAA
jgi:hypothetical protein